MDTCLVINIPASRSEIRSMPEIAGAASAGDAAFESSPYYLDACRLRRWEERGKIAGIACPDFAHFRPILMRTRID